MNICQEGKVDVLLATEGDILYIHNGNKMEHFSYKGDWVYVQQCILKNARLQLHSITFGLKQFCTTLKKFQY